MATAVQQPGIRLQPRDIDILTGLFESRIMTLAHITAMYMDGRKEAAKKRVQKLKRAGYIRERARHPYEPAVLMLTRAGFRLLRGEGALEGYPEIDMAGFDRRARISDLTIKHELAVMDVKAAFARAVNERPELKVAEFSTWPRLHSFYARPNGDPWTKPAHVKPDGFIRIHERGKYGKHEYSFFLEVDRSTESLCTLERRIFCYCNHCQTNSYVPHAPVRILFVCRSAKRCRHIAARFSLYYSWAKRHVWVTVRDDLLNHPLGAIWLCASSYHATSDHGLHGQHDQIGQAPGTLPARQNEFGNFKELL